MTLENCQKSNSIPDADQARVDANGENCSKVVETSSIENGTPPWKSDTYGDLQQNKACLYQHSSIKKILKKFI